MCTMESGHDKGRRFWQLATWNELHHNDSHGCLLLLRQSVPKILNVKLMLMAARYKIKVYVTPRYNNYKL